MDKNNGVNDKKDLKTDEGNLTYPEYGDREHNKDPKPKNSREKHS